MPYDSQGNFTRLHSWEQDRIDDIDIVTDHHDAEDDNFAEGLNHCFLRDGTVAMRGNINIGGFKLTRLANGVSKDDAVNLEQLRCEIKTLKAEMTTTINNSLVVGDIKCSALQQDYKNWLICDGRELSRQEYADLFKVIGTTFGGGNNVTTFNIPDCRGVVVRGTDRGRGLDSGRVFGSYQKDELKQHTHYVAGAHSSCPGGARLIDVYSASDAELIGNLKTTSGVIEGSAAETRVKNIALNYFIKVKED